ncbi:MAG: LTA synthase family protein [Clostridia bacterium]|nr:LTA synthase family protein [Clostridia bacterium]
MKKKIICIFIVICVLIAFAGTVTFDWLYETFGHLSIDEIIFHLKVPMQGANTEIIITFLKICIWKVIIPTAIISCVLIYPMVKDLKVIDDKIHTSERKRTVVVSFSISIIILIISLSSVIKKTDIIEYIKSQTDNSNFIANEYVDPKKVDVKFEEEKRNLIYIFLESMETTYHSKENGGLSEQELIPELANLAQKNINFKNTEKIGGASILSGTSWTVGAMTAQTTGLPLKLKIDANALGKYSVFLEGAYSIGEILENNGYHNFLLLGSEATFGGRKNLFEQHGNYEIWDFESAIKENAETEKIWWGFTDNKLYNYAKGKILELSQKEEPFNFTMLTTDTHFPEGYYCESCVDKWDEQYKNVISCASKKVNEFIKWIEEQEFYNNTTIVIVGDHLTMQSNFFEIEEGQEYEKKVVSIIINPAKQPQSMEQRLYSTMDLYPTTLAAIGATIEGEKLGLGANLFSSEETLIEKYGLEYVNNELNKNSKFYDNNILVSR